MNAIEISKESLDTFKKQKMKNFIIDVDFVMSKSIDIEAENEEQAKEIFDAMMGENPYNFAYKFDSFVKYNVIDVIEE